MRAGTLRHRVTLQTNAPIRQTDGSMEDSWADVVTVWGSVEPLTGRERFRADQLESEVDVRIRIRYRSGVSAQMRVKFGSRYYLIEAPIDPLERHREIELLCREVDL